MNTPHQPRFNLGSSWNEALKDQWNLPYITALKSFIEKERNQNIPVFPPKDLVFDAFIRTPFDMVKVVIMGQDPYHGPNQAHGLCFSVSKGIPLPPSLKNIYKELSADLGIEIPSHGCLNAWADQGVLLLNATLTVRQGEPLSHYGKGWELFTDAVISQLITRKEPIIFVLWGKSAQEKCRYLHSQPHSPHFVLTAPHPSPFSAHQGFFGCRHFSKTNEILLNFKKSIINWKIN